MTIIEKTTVSFDPIKEYKAMMDWIKNNNMNEWVHYESTVAYVFVKEKTTFLEMK